MSQWQNKVVVITGGSRGLGFQIAHAFGQAGAHVVIVARDESCLAAAANRLQQLQCRVTALAADITDVDQVTQLFEHIHNLEQRIDVLVNCAGRSARGRAADTSPEQFRELWELNFLALVRCTQAALPQLVANHGHLVNVGSLASKSVGQYLGAYPASKFPVAAYSQQLRMELADCGVHVLLVCPGPLVRDDAGQRYADQTGDLPAAATRPGGGTRVKGILPERVAQQILVACQRRRPELVVPGRARWLFAISQLWPSFGDWLLRKMTS